MLNLTASFSLVSLIVASLRMAYAQQVGTNNAENHPRLNVRRCSTQGGCTVRSQSVVLDSNWRWTHNVGGSTNCYTGNTWNSNLCPDPATCTRNCAIDGADYAGTYGFTTNGDALTLRFVTQGPYSTNVGSRVYLLDTDDTNYQQFNLLNQEFTFDVDVSNLPCGLNGALYFAQLPRDGGLSQFSGNRAGARYGTGYCDAQCPHDIKFINGEANILDWRPSSSDPNAGTGRYGSCCAEMDIWEANRYATAYTSHVCSTSNQYRCSGTECGDGTQRYQGVCDKDGCDFNSYRLGNQSFFGPGSLVNSNARLTVVTQFIANGGSLSEIRRLYVQNGRTIANSRVNVPGIEAGNSISDRFCQQQKSVFQDPNVQSNKGGFANFGQALSRGMVLVMSLWDDHEGKFFPLNL